MRWLVVLIPFVFLLRRLMTIGTLVYWNEFFWGQVAVQIMISVFMVILIGWFRPLDSKFANNIEIFNEIISIFTLYMMMCFSDFVPKAEDRSNIGIYFISILGVYAFVHFTFLFLDLGAKIKGAIRKCCHKLFGKKWQMKKLEKQKKAAEKVKEKEEQKKVEEDQRAMAFKWSPWARNVSRSENPQPTARKLIS